MTAKVKQRGQPWQLRPVQIRLGPKEEEERATFWEEAYTKRQKEIKPGAQ